MSRDTKTTLSNFQKGRKAQIERAAIMMDKIRKQRPTLTSVLDEYAKQGRVRVPIDIENPGKGSFFKLINTL